MTLYNHGSRCASHSSRPSGRELLGRVGSRATPDITVTVIVHPDTEPSGVLALYLDIATTVVERRPAGYQVVKSTTGASTYTEAIATSDFVLELKSDSVRFIKITERALPLAGGDRDER